MLNNVVLVGRLTKDPSLSEGENETKRLNITIAIPRDYKNQDGIYDTDFISCVLWNTVRRVILLVLKVDYKVVLT